MRPTRLTVALFLLVVLVQLVAPTSEIAGRELTLRTGTPVKFRTTPVDPADAFRGRYVWLDVEQNTAPVPDATSFRTGQHVFALIETDATGFAHITGLSATRPASGLFLAVPVRWVDRTAAGGYQAHLAMPFDRFYMEETLAPMAEEAYRRASDASRQQAYIVVRLRDGQGVIEDLYINDTPIRQFLATGGR
ncbi:MAG: GDYXXLXY domain-containing protein [Chloroflexi bacterium]|nr:GDYXXLXY domain-containing protein [Chloroflexota bacterium]